MAWPKPLLIDIALWIVPLGRGAMTDIIILDGLLCADPSAVRPAVAASDPQEIERLGCATQKPYSLGFRVLRCEPEGMDGIPKSFRPIRRDTTLPYGVCEVEAILANEQVVTAYTDYVLIVSWSRLRRPLPRFHGPKAQ